MSIVKACVIGSPIKQSKSPLIHNHWIAEHGLKGEYTAVEILPENLEQDVQRLIDSGYAGFNVTAPHKQEIFKLCESVDDTARKIGAVNTVVVRDGKLHGTNTDAFGFIENVHRNTFGTDFLHKPAVVLGAGGAARAVVYALIEAGAKKIIVLNRTKEKAEEIRKDYPLEIFVGDWAGRNALLDGAGLLVNTTALGMSGKDPLDIDLSSLPKEAVVSDIVYAPLMTDLLKQAESRGHQIVTGIGMLLHQARPAFEKWFGVLPEVSEALEKKVLT
ncbi:MAG: shikimate dehydrogenase [Micavibrio aeruginosavorus]|uniref:Shikimate dehydrogenase (NADP(+)) n=1 Tax=Micavibrio aeruginosavorus TaxID=349221 RepID=A0A2W5NEA9_9BACT|nr:MAG: shikimate dehydrogenase [Micavibrio aeruginosavorus]